jgi:hypothetical protein
MRRTAWPMLVPALALLALPGMAGAQSLAQRAAALRDGTLRLSFPARDGVCGNRGRGFTITDDTGEWVADCDRGPVRVSLQVRGGRVTDVRTYVGGRWRVPAGPVTDLGILSARATAADLLALAEQTSIDAGPLITAATLADSATVWPALLRIARRPALPIETRRQAVFWLGQAAGEAATRGLDSLASEDTGELEVRKQAVFALSQRPADEGVVSLIHIARTSPHPEIRKTALFWLGQSEDPRALELFEEILQ